jgi:hypothetical protein
MMSCLLKEHRTVPLLDTLPLAHPKKEIAPQLRIGPRGHAPGPL